MSRDRGSIEGTVAREDSGVFDPLASPCHIDVWRLIRKIKSELIIKLIAEVMANSRDKYIKTN